METGLTTSEEAPRPPEQVRFLSIEAEPYADALRVRLAFALTPFAQRPNVEVQITDAEGEEVSSLSIIGPMMPKFAVTAHLRGGPRPGAMLRVIARLGYDDLPDVDRRELSLSLPAVSQHE